MRVAIPITRNYFEWLGGLNYLRTLSSAVLDAGSGSIEPVFIVPRDRPEGLMDGFPPGPDVHETSLLDGPGAAWAARALALRGTGTDLGFDRLLRRLGVDMLSHHSPLGRRAGMPTLSWIPDMQHRRLPELFDRATIAARDRELRRIDAHAAGVVVSSEAGRADLEEAVPGVEGRVGVLRFVPDLGSPVSDREVEETRSAFGLERFLYLPNQVWVHKNHRVVVEALGLMRGRGQPATVVMTGDTTDPRSPGLAGELENRAAALGVAGDVRLLGRVEYSQVRALMTGAEALVNPSLFEGWSTTVEEARALGKRAVLSDIDVHREQDVPGAVYADPRSPEAFADALAGAWEPESPATELARRTEAERDHPRRRAAFAAAYEDICARLNR